MKINIELQLKLKQYELQLAAKIRDLHRIKGLDVSMPIRFVPHFQEK